MNDRKIDSSIVVFYRRNESSDVVKAKLQNMQSKKKPMRFLQSSIIKLYFSLIITYFERRADTEYIQRTTDKVFFKRLKDNCDKSK